MLKSTELGTKRLRLLKDEFPITYLLSIAAHSRRRNQKEGRSGYQINLIRISLASNNLELDKKKSFVMLFQIKTQLLFCLREVVNLLCYQLPAYTKNGTVLIVSPLVALMEDQVAIMKKNGEKRVVALNSFLAFKERQRIMNQLELYKFIFVSPEMLMQKNVAEQFTKIKIAFIVVDEAHCISQWGFDFRPDYLRIGEFLKQLDRPNILALTATADDQSITRYRSLFMSGESGYS